MNRLLTTLTRRTALRLIGGGAAGAALAAYGGLTRVLGAVAVPSAAAAADPNATVEAAGGAGLFDVDPDQANVSQDPTVAITGDVAALPVDMVP